MARGTRLLAAAAALFAAGWLAGDLVRGRREPPSRRVLGRGFRLVSPLLDVELPAGWAVTHEPISFQKEVERYVAEQIGSGRVWNLAVYYRDLLDGPWFGVNADATFNPASMMKVPVMIAWLKRAQRQPGVLLETMTFDEREYPAPPREEPAERTLSPGGRYTVEQLLQFMIGFSDNRAMWLLYRALTAEEVAGVLDSMDVANAADEGGNRISARGYSGFFRILFNAAYLDPPTSEQALELLALQRFPKGLAAGVPPGTPVAAKFGEWTAEPGRVQLHEFGIVYHPDGPYILGVMTEGTDWGDQARILAEVSRLVYREAASHAPRGAAR